MERTTQQATLENFNDMAKVVEGTLLPVNVRSVTVDFLVDTGAAMLCLPTHVIEQLGLFQHRTVRSQTANAQTANGIVQAKVYSHVRLSILDREASMEVMEIPDGTPPLLGYLPLEMLALSVNPTPHTSPPVVGSTRFNAR